MQRLWHPWGLVGLLMLVVLVVGCANQAPAPIEQKAAIPSPSKPTGHRLQPVRTKVPIRGDIYRVQAGDTLYSIAWRLGLDFRQLATLNELQNPSHIVVGQALRVRAARTPPAPSVSPKIALRESDPTSGPAASAGAPMATQTATSGASGTPKIPAGIAASNRQWVWPAEGRTSRAVSATGSIGLEIRGTRGQTIRAADGGQVVYGGSGLRGYGQLLIIKHDERFLSAYAHNDKLLVSEGQQIERGQPIALMGDSGASEVMLHFEIRKGGKAVEPLQYLPKR